jgi:hypothetical protein
LSRIMDEFERKAELSLESPSDGYSSSRTTAHPRISQRLIDGRIAIRCRECGEMTPDLKLFFPLKFVFLGYIIFHEREAIEACPHCMRSRLLNHVAIGLLTANIFWPIAILAPSVYYLFLTFRPGHSPLIGEWYWKEFVQADSAIRPHRGDAASESEGRSV